MAMEINSVYGNYASTYTNSKDTKQTKDTKSAGETTSASETKKSESTAQTSKDYLSSLRQKYPDVNITVVDFKSQKQKLSYMIGSSGGNNVAISQSVIDKMASDPAAAAKYEKVIADTPDFGKWAKETAESEPGCKHIASGICIDKEGKVTYWGVGSKTTEGPGTKEKMQKMLEEKRIEKKKQNKAEAKKKEDVEKQEALGKKQAEKRAAEKERMKLMLAEGNSADEVVSAIANGKAEMISENEISGIDAGSRINLTV